MVWRRLPTFLPNFPLRMLPLSEEQMTQLKDTGWLREVAFRTQPRVNKLEIRSFLETVHGLQVERVATINYLGKKKRRYDPKGRSFWVRLSDWKKAYVTFKPPPEVQAQWEAAQQGQVAQAVVQARQAQLPAGGQQAPQQPPQQPQQQPPEQPPQLPQS